ncbi:MAG TPA: pitrilysin family protein [Candidatus Krumholzibacteria bacterium]|nr:pitrilysin family protein [Candidatus Krumholzibacteria bacterium]HRX51569.1 pitrilysin family protein [Candidatus Krumholzibacteria bacterium]
MIRFLQKTAALLLLMTLAVGLTAADASAARKKPWEKLKYDDLGSIELPAYDRVALDNGMILYLCEDHSLPMVQLSATIQAGALYEPAALTGLAGITGEVLRTGGTAKWTGDEIDEMVESMGASVETFIGDATGGAFLFALNEDADKALEILASVLMEPAFDAEKVDLAKTQAKSGIARRNDEPMQIVFREFQRVMFGPDHPLARLEEYDTINAITRDDLVRFHADYFGPDRTYLVVIGDFDAKTMVGKIEAAFAGWKKAGAPLPADPEIPALPRTINVAAKEDLTQAMVALGVKGVRNDDPNYAAIQVANQILGGGFSSRLFNEIRSKRGLAYTTGSQAGTGWRFPGVFVAFTGTKNETAQQAAEVMFDEIRRMGTEPVSAEELRMAVDGILNSDVFNYDTKREVLDRLVLFEMNGYPEDFLSNYRQEVQAMTAEKVMAAAQAVWKVDDMSLLAVGNPADFDGDMSVFGPVNQIDITIPEPQMTLDVPAATAESLAAGQSLMAKAGKAVSPKVQGLKSYTSKLNLALEIQGMPMNFGIEMVAVLPDRMKMVQKTPFGEMSQVMNGDEGWAKGPMGTQDIPAEQMDGLREQLDSDLIMLLRNHADLTCQALDAAEVDGVMCDRVYVTGVGEDFILICLDQATGLPFMQQSKGADPMTGSPVVQKTYYKDYKDFGGAKYASNLVITHDDEEFATGTISELSLNPKVDASVFKR